LSLSPAWQQLFPIDDATKVVDLLQQTWDELVSKKTPRFDLTSKEPHLTQFLQSVLKTKALPAGLTGLFIAERLDAVADLTTGKLVKRSRSDICYFTNESHRLLLTFEFKKLSHTNTSHKAYCKDGILRFVEGKYSNDEPLALMVGMVEAIHKSTCIQGIQIALNNPIVALANPISTPSQVFPNHAEFDSEHCRCNSYPNIILSHLFLVY
jgi:hypothetical protein